MTAQLARPGHINLWRILLAAALVFMVLLGGTDAGRLLVSLRTAAAFVGGALILVYLVKAPQEHDIVDLLVLGGLLLFLVTCITSSMPRFSFEAATTATAFAAAFYVARGALSDARGRSLALTVLGILGAGLSFIFLFIWGGIWLQWLAVPDAGLPPLSLDLPPGPFGHRYHVAMLAALLLPAVVMLARRPHARLLGLTGSVAGLAVVLMSGSRGLWLAGVIALVVGGIASGGIRMGRKGWGAIAVGGVLAVIGIVALSEQLLSRLVATSTVELRLATWGASIEGWLTSPIAGSGPGTYASELVFTGYHNTYDRFVWHAHNPLVQVLLEGGVVGLLGLSLIAAALLVGIARAGHVPWAPAAAITFFVTASLADNPSVIGYVVIPLVVWSALACPRLASPRVSPHRGLRAASFGLAAVIAVAAVAPLGAAGAFDRASAAAQSGNTTRVLAELASATRLDPSFALYHRELGVWLMSKGRTAAAREQLSLAVRLNPGDDVTLRAVALLELQSGNGADALASAQAAAARAEARTENPLTLAYVGMVLGDEDAFWTGVVEAVRREPWLLAAPEWDAVFPQSPKREIIVAAQQSWADVDEFSGRNLKARTWLAAMRGGPAPRDSGPVLDAEAAVIRCDSAAGTEALAQLTGAAVVESGGLLARLMFERAFGEPESPEVRTLIALRDRALERQLFGQVVGSSAAGDWLHDRNIYNRTAIRPPVGPILPTPDSGLGAWLANPGAAARAGAPGSGLANCG